MQLFPMAAFQMKHKNLWVMPSYSTVATCGEPSCIELLRRESKSSPVLMDERATDLLSDWIDRQSGSTTCEVKKKTKIPTQNYQPYQSTNIQSKRTVQYRQGTLTGWSGRTPERNIPSTLLSALSCGVSSVSPPPPRSSSSRRRSRSNLDSKRVVYTPDIHSSI